jgi:hypothetical protein
VAFGARGSDVEMVMVNGRVVVEDGELTTVDTHVLVERAVAQSKDLRERVVNMPIAPVWELPTL